MRSIPLDTLVTQPHGEDHTPCSKHVDVNVKTIGIFPAGVELVMREALGRRRKSYPLCFGGPFPFSTTEEAYITEMCS